MSAWIRVPESAYVIKAEEAQWVLAKDTERVDKRGDPVYTDYRYFPTIEWLTRALYELRVRSSDMATMQDIATAHRDALDWIRSFWSSVKAEMGEQVAQKKTIKGQ